MSELDLHTSLAPDLRISRVVTGLWQLADMERDGRSLDKDGAARSMKAYTGAGLTTFDMADHYGSAEEIAGTFLREHAGGDDVQLLTKWVPKPGGSSRATVRSAKAHIVDSHLSWHGRIMVFGWGFIAPLGIVAARYFKILPWQDWPNELDNPTWWRSHWIGQTGVILLTFLGLVIILTADTAAGSAPVHRVLGYGVVGLAVLQGLSGVFRGSKGGPTDRSADGSLSGDHYDMTGRRLAFEVLHKVVGYLLLITATLCILFGLWAANAPIWMWLSICLCWLALAAAAAWIEVHYGSYDTYQAIWGPDPDLPGNQIRKQGFGTVRPGSETAVWGRRTGNRLYRQNGGVHDKHTRSS